MTYRCSCPSAVIIVYIFWLGLNDRAVGFSFSPRLPLTGWKWKSETSSPYFSPMMRGIPRRAQSNTISGNDPDDNKKRSAVSSNSTTDRLPQWLVSMESPPPWILTDGTVPCPSDHVDEVSVVTKLFIHHMLSSPTDLPEWFDQAKGPPPFMRMKEFSPPTWLLRANEQLLNNIQDTFGNAGPPNWMLTVDELPAWITDAKQPLPPWLATFTGGRLRCLRSFHQ
jgi:hypothetical protein